MRTARRIITFVSSFVLVVVGAIAFSPVPALAANGNAPAGVTINSYAPDWDLTVDCAVFPYGTEDVFLPGRVTDTMTVHTVNCSTYIYDLTTDYDYAQNHPAGFNPSAQSAEWGASPKIPDIWRASDAIPSTFTITPGVVFYFNEPSYGSNYSAVGFLATPEVEDPSGVLAYSQEGTLEATSSHFDAIGGGFFHYLNGNTNCRMVEGSHPYATFDVEITEQGDYTFRFVKSDPIPSLVYSWNPYHPMNDTLLAIYTSFDPANPEANVVDCNDQGAIYPSQTLYAAQSGDILSWAYPQFSSTLDPAVSAHYTLVMTTYNAYNAALWNSYNYGTGTGTYEMWGPQDGFVIPEEAILPGSENNGSNESAAPTEPTLPATGAKDASILESVWLAGAFGIVGITLVVARRRLRARRSD